MRPQRARGRGTDMCRRRRRRFLAPPAPRPFYAPHVPPPGMRPGMGMGMGAGMWTPPEGCYMHFPSEPVIAPTGPPSAVCYTTVAKYAFADATVVFRVSFFYSPFFCVRNLC